MRTQKKVRISQENAARKKTIREYKKKQSESPGSKSPGARIKKKHNKFHKSVVLVVGVGWSRTCPYGTKIPHSSYRAQ
jgi:hypothetical protein